MIEAKNMEKYINGESDRYYADEISNALLRFSEVSVSDGAKLECDITDAVYQLKAIAQNEYNSDYWRVLWNALQNMAEKLEYA